MVHMLAAGSFFFNGGIFQDLSQPLLWFLAISFATPLILASTGGTISERSGVVNIAMEGMMLVGAFFSAYTVDQIVNLAHLPAWAGTLFGVLGAVAAGCLIAGLHAIACVRFRANQVIVGMAINLFALGLTSYLYFTIYPNGTPGSLPGIPPLHIPAIHFSWSIVHLNLGSLSDLRFMSLGYILFQQNPIVYIAFALVIIAHVFLFHTTLGLRIRSVGEHPRAADTAGINVQRLRYLAIILSGGLSGLGGSYFALNGSGLFSDDMTQGRGFIALAAMIVGKWTPFGATGACLLFGFGESMSIILGGNTTIGSYTLSTYMVNMLPYLITIIAVTGIVGR
ncbi:MAG TPA: ABC transporter permease, partial [Chloroflexota bacterium]|nr:ABC transporter permease [Chloroflexota bacterium]